MKTEERLQELLDRKDAEIESLRAKLSAAEDCARLNWLWTVHEGLPTDPFPTLPIPRLELRWVTIAEDHQRRCGYAFQCRYDLVMRHLDGSVVRVPLGSTLTSGQEIPINTDGTISLPYRDGCHIAHDSAHLQLPAFAIHGETIQPIGLCHYTKQQKMGIEHRSCAAIRRKFCAITRLPPINRTVLDPTQPDSVVAWISDDGSLALENAHPEHDPDLKVHHLRPTEAARLACIILGGADIDRVIDSVHAADAIGSAVRAAGAPDLDQMIDHITDEIATAMKSDAFKQDMLADLKSTRKISGEKS